MANISTVSTPFGASTEHANAARKPGVFRKILAAIMESRRRKAEIEIAAYLAERGETTASLWDDMEIARSRRSIRR